MRDLSTPALDIHPDIACAETLPATFYTDPANFAAQVDAVLARGWHFYGDAGQVPGPGDFSAAPLLPGSLDEPLVMVRGDADAAPRLLANVCPHRGNLVAAGTGCAKALRCGYHGRRFDLSGAMLSAPEFEGAQNFPRPEDSLATVPSGHLFDLVFAAVAPRVAFADLIAPVLERVDWLPLDQMQLDPGSLRDYEFDGHWALYCDNYLEGFHVPYVHPGLAKVLDYRQYRTELFPGGSLQLGVASGTEPALDPPPGHPDHGLRIGGYYFFLAPGIMLNFYPWGLSLNAVRPQGLARTRVHFRAYVWDESLRTGGAGGALDEVELEDEAVVASVSQGIRSRFYRRGRYSPSQELGVHHFHRQLASELAGDA